MNGIMNVFRAFQNLTFFTYVDLSRNHLTAEALTEEVFYGKYHGNKEGLPSYSLNIHFESCLQFEKKGIFPIQIKLV